jgi:hypothetical protein
MRYKVLHFVYIFAMSICRYNIMICEILELKNQATAASRNLKPEQGIKNLKSEFKRSA